VTARPVLRVLNPDATDDEVAAILAAVALCTQTVVASHTEAGETLQEWVRSTRLSARGAGLQRGPWRLSGRIGRRARA